MLATLIPDLQRDAGLRALLVPNLRLARDRIAIPRRSTPRRRSTWYLLIEPEFADHRSAGMALFRREGAEFVAHAVAADGGRLVTEEPFRFGVDAAALVDS